MRIGQAIAVRLAISAFVALLIVLTSSDLSLSDDTPVDQQQLVGSVMSRLLQVVERPNNSGAWPPKWSILSDDEPQALAVPVNLSGNKDPMIQVTSGLLKNIVENNPHRLALVLGHELGHLILGHIPQSPATKSLTGLAFLRADEIDADEFGMRLLLKAGYSYREAITAYEMFIDKYQNSEYSSFDGTKKDHPNWKDRLALLEADASRKKLWRAMSAFDNGVAFLKLQQFGAAEAGFERVTSEFPDCYEAWANLGYARLMKYCDALETDDLRRFDVGQLVVGAFYSRPGSIVPTRGIDAKLWFQSVTALNKALELSKSLGVNDEMLPVHMSLAIAYFLKPEGRDLRRVEAAVDEIEKELADPRRSANLGSMERAQLSINVGVICMGKPASKTHFDEAAKLLGEIDLQRGTPGTSPLSLAIKYNQSFSLRQTSNTQDRQVAVRLLEDYLVHAPPSLNWWALAYERYVALCAQLKQVPKTKEQLARSPRPSWRALTSVTLRDKTLLTISDPIDQIEKRLGPPAAKIPIDAQGRLNRLEYPDRGASIVAGTEVLAVFVHGACSPSIELRREGLAGETVTVAVGLDRKTFEKTLGDVDNPPLEVLIDSSSRDKVFTFYESVGIGARFVKGKVDELVIAAVPIQMPDTK